MREQMFTCNNSIVKFFFGAAAVKNRITRPAAHTAESLQVDEKYRTSGFQTHRRVDRKRFRARDWQQKIQDLWAKAPVIIKSAGAANFSAAWRKISTRHFAMQKMPVCKWLMPVFDIKVNLSCVFQQRRTLSVANPNTQTILRICIIFGQH